MRIKSYCKVYQLNVEFMKLIWFFFPIYAAYSICIPLDILLYYQFTKLYKQV